MLIDLGSFFLSIANTADHNDVGTFIDQMGAHPVKAFNLLRVAAFEETDKTMRVALHVVLGRVLVLKDLLAFLAVELCFE